MMLFTRTFKLADWCLEVIVENLDKFVYSKAVPQKHMDFLLRLHSEEIFQQYNFQNTITEDCMLWFLTPHSKKITLCTVTVKVVERLQIVGPTITSLNLHNSLAAENMLISIVCCVPNVKHLDLSSTSCSDKLLSCLSKFCPELVTLNLKKCQSVTDQGMENLSDTILSLKELDITFTNVFYSGLFNILKGMPTLECLKFQNMADAFYAAHRQAFIISAQYNLTELIYDELNFSNEPLPVISVWTVMCPKVKKVHFNFPVSEEALHMCTSFQNLEEIKIDTPDLRINDVLAPISLVANNLSTLILYRLEIPTVTLIESFRNLKHLILLNVDFTKFEEEDVKATENKLETIYIKDTRWPCAPTTNNAITLLISKSKNVTNLYLNLFCGISEDLHHLILNSMKHLTLVDFSFTNMKVNSVIPFFEIPTMQMIYFDVGHNLYTDPFLKKLSQNSACTLSWHITDDDSDDSDMEFD